MLKGHVFSKQIFGNPIFALFINTFLNGQNGISNNYKNGMQVTYNGSNVTIASGAVCIQGRFLEEDTSTTLSAGTNPAYCKLVIEIDLDKQNTETELNQASYRIVTSSASYPSLTQTNIVKNNAGIYQYELARFRTDASGISSFQDMRTFLDFNSIYEQIKKNYQSILDELEQELANVKDGSDYLLKSAGGTVAGPIVANGGITGNLKGNSDTATKLQTARNISLSGDVTGSASFDGTKNIIINAILAKSYEQKIQFGSNSNGNYAKFNDGTLLQWGSHTYRVSTDESYYDFAYRSGEDYFGKEAYPIHFTKLDYLEIDSIAQGNFHTLSIIKRFGNINKLTNLPSLTFISPNKTNVANNIDCFYLAIGKWK